MASTPPISSPGSDFMEEFYAECDDHLVEIRRGLLRLEEQLGELSLDRDALEKIFRSFHSLKGICGMAGLQPAEKLAHRAEDYLRALTRQETVLTDEGLDSLNCVTQQLEELVMRHRQRLPAPDIGALLEDIGRLTENPDPSRNYPAEVNARIAAAHQEGKNLWLAEFAPSPALDHRGMNVSAARTLLSTASEILYGTPKVHGTGGLRFEFVVATSGDIEDRSQWAEDGITLGPLEAPAQSAMDAPAAGASA